MAIDKISQYSLKSYNTPNFKGETNKEPQKTVEAKDTEKIKASNLMVGATALAAVVLGSLGLYHHFNSKAAKKVAQEGAEALREQAETVADTVGEKANDIVDTVTETVTSNVDEAVDFAVEEILPKADEAINVVAEEVIPKTEKIIDNVQPKVDEQVTQTLLDASIAKGKDIYAKVDKELHTPTKLNGEQIDKNLAPKEKPNSWNSAEMNSYYKDLEQATAKLSQIKEGLTTINEGGNKEVLQLFERVKNGEEISTADLEKMSEEFVQRMQQQAEKANPDVSQIKNEEIIREITNLKETFERRTNKLALSMKKGLPALIEARKNGINKTPEIIGNFEELLNKAEALDVSGHTEEVINILKELRKQDIVQTARKYQHYLAGFDERNILTGHDMHDFTILNLDKYSEPVKKAEDLVERFRNIVNKNDTYKAALMKKTALNRVAEDEVTPAIIQAQALDEVVNTGENALKTTEFQDTLSKSTEYERQMRDLTANNYNSFNPNKQSTFGEDLIPDEGIKINDASDMFPSDNGFDFHNSTDDMFPSNHELDFNNTTDDIFQTDGGIDIDSYGTDFSEF